MIDSFSAVFFGVWYKGRIGTEGITHDTRVLYKGCA